MNPAGQQQPRVIGAVERSQSLMQSDMPQRVWISFRVALRALIGLGLIAGSAAALSAPIVRQVSGTLTHRSEEHTSELQSHSDLVCRLLLEKKKTKTRELPPQ